MSSATVLIVAVVALGLLYVVLPVAADAYGRARGSRIVVCPEMQSHEEITLDAPRAAISAAFGASTLAVRDCSRWPEGRACTQRCVALLAETAHAANPAT